MSELTTPQPNSKPVTVVIVSGAGISAGSGIPTYRCTDDTSGLWNIHDMKKICTRGNELSPESVAFYDTFHKKVQSVQPNDIHRWMADLQEESKDTKYKVALFTQNIDDLLEKAGCTDVHHIHGFINEIKCLSCNHIWAFTPEPTCPKCNSNNTKYNVVFYGDKGYYQEMLRHLLDLKPDDIFILIGTSNAAINVDLIVRPIKCVKIYINPVAEPTVKLSQYQHVFLEKAEGVLPEVTQLISAHMDKFSKTKIK